ncbi:MAG: nitrous oxide reductase family maturation protein NosD [Chromatiales bacterium]|jgi:nitrous oxidase accessory protein
METRLDTGSGGLSGRSLARWLLLAGLLLSVLVSASDYPPFQELVDASDPWGRLVPPAGTYAGPVVIKTPITIDGQGQVTIDGGGQGSIVTLQTDGATLMNLHLTNSGDSHNDLDAAIQVQGNFNVIKDNLITDSLFGVNLQQVESNLVKRNRISSKPVDLGLRGDAIRLWYSFNNEVTDNIIRDSRDTVVWYSRDNLFARNDARGGRYSLHFMYSQANEVVDNHYENNSVGIFLMYSDGVKLLNNTIARASGATGMGIGFKETSDVDVIGNRILYCGTGLYLDVSPYQPDTTNRIKDNLIAYNGVGIQFLNDWTGNQIEGNRFKGNITQVAVSGGGKTANRNRWNGNYWDDYEGFDLNRDGIGDAPYELYSYADRLWMDVPPARFFKGSPVLEVLDFLERLAPFTAPNMLVRDDSPLMYTEIPDRPVPPPAPPAMPPDSSATGSAAFDAYKTLRESLGR